ncbi:CHASE2 domain-containing protein [Chloroflexota bacterium]
MVTSTTSNGKRSWQQTRRLYHILVLLGVGGIFTLIFTFVQPFHSIDLWLSDQLFIPAPPSPDIVIVGIDDDTFETYGAWGGWPRSLHAQAINNLSKAGAKVIGFDILFADKGSDDEVMVAAMESAGNIVLPLVGSEYQPSNDPKITYTHILSPVSPLEQASVNTGHANLSPDIDGIIRRLPLVIRDSTGQTYPAFSLAVLHTLFDTPSIQEFSRQDGVLHLLDRDIPVDTHYRFRVNFTSEDQSRPYISYRDAINGDFDPVVVENKIILIGMTATGELDKWAVPISTNRKPGVFIHAITIDNILRSQFLTEVGIGTNLMIMLLLVGVTGFALPRLGLRWGGVIVGSLFAGYLVTSFITFENGYIVHILYPLLLLPIIYISSILVQNAATMIENAKLNQKVSDGYKSTIVALAASIDAKDHYTRGHSQRVTEYALMAARRLSMTREELEILEYAGILHDIGKIGIPDSILTNSNSLTNEEWKVVRQHPLIGANITKGIPFFEESRKVLLHHHEKYDGNGYPDSLQGDDIPLGARLLAVADSFDSMTSDRPYRSALSTECAIEELQKCSGTQFCPVAVNAFISEYRMIYPQ